MADDEHDGEVQVSHLRKLLEKRLLQLAQSAHFADSADPARALHDLRVAARRLRAFGDVLRGLLGGSVHGKIDKPLKRVLGEVASVRDRDVQIALVSRLRDTSQTDLERATLEYLLERLDGERAVAARHAEKKLGKKDFDALRKSVLAALEGAVEAFPKRGPVQRLLARELLGELIDKAASVPRAEGEAVATHAHHLRIAVKKLRYALEIFEPLLGQGYASLTERATVLQDLLGDHHDRVVLGDFVAEIAQEFDARNRSSLAAGARSVIAGLGADRKELEARLGRDGFDAAFFRVEVGRGTNTD